MKRVLAVVGCAALAAAVAAAPPRAAAPAPLPPAKLVAQLGSESYAEREAATAALEQSGSAALAALEAAARDPNPEINGRAQRLLARLRLQLESKERLAPRMVRLAYEKTPLSAAAIELKRATGINLQLDVANIANPQRLVTCTTGELPPWEAVAAFCRAAGLKEVFAAELDVPKQENMRRGYAVTPMPSVPDQIPIKLADGKYVELPGSRATAVRVLALPASFPAHRVYLGTGNLLLHFDVAPMPGLNWRDVTGIRVTRVVDSAGRPGSGSTPQAPPASAADYNGVVFFGGNMGMMAMGDLDIQANPTTYPNPRVIPVPIHVATNAARSLKVLEGVVMGEVEVPNQPLVTINNLAASVGVPAAGAGGIKFTVLEVGSRGKLVDLLKVQIEMPLNLGFPRNAMFNGFLEPQRPGMVSHRLKGYDAAGKPVRMSGSTSEFANDGMSMTSITQYTCPDGLPVKVVYSGPKAVMVEVPFKMENVPLP